MIDPSLRRPFLAFLAIAACLSLCLQTAGPLPFTEPAADTLPCAEASWGSASALPGGTPGDGPRCNESSSAASLLLGPGLDGVPLPHQRRFLAADRTPLAEGFPSEIFHPPTGTV